MTAGNTWMSQTFNVDESDDTTAPGLSVETSRSGDWFTLRTRPDPPWQEEPWTMLVHRDDIAQLVDWLQSQMDGRPGF